MTPSHWLSRFRLPTEGLGQYTVLIRWEHDDERVSRAEARKHYGGHNESATAWMKFKDIAPAAWAEHILGLFVDGKPRTFNQIMLDLTARTQTSDTAFGENPFHGLQLALADGRLMCTNQAPIFFLPADERATSTRKARALEDC